MLGSTSFIVVLCVCLCVNAFDGSLFTSIRERKEKTKPYVSKVGLLIDGSHFLGSGRDVRRELGNQNGPAACYRTGQFSELAQTFSFVW